MKLSLSSKNRLDFERDRDFVTIWK